LILLELLISPKSCDPGKKGAREALAKTARRSAAPPSIVAEKGTTSHRGPGTRAFKLDIGVQRHGLTSPGDLLGVRCMASPDC